MNMEINRVDSQNRRHGIWKEQFVGWYYKTSNVHGKCQGHWMTCSNEGEHILIE